MKTLKQLFVFFVFITIQTQYSHELEVRLKKLEIRFNRIHPTGSIGEVP